METMETTDWLLDDTEREQTPTTWLTLEAAAYLAIGLLAAVLRLGWLGLRPLVEREASQALAAWSFVQGASQGAPPGTLPALFTGNVAVFSLLGASDGTARLWPALAGVVLVLLPYGLRYRLGRGGALVASLLLALSPTLLFSARSLDGATLAAVCGLALVVGGIRFLDTQQPASLYLAAGALGLGLASGPGFYTVLLILVLWGLGLYVAGRTPERAGGWSSLAESYDVLRANRQGLLARAGALAGALFGLAATTFVLHPAGIGHAADLLGAWIRGLAPQPGGQPVAYLVLVLLRYETAIVFLGLLEAGRWLAVRAARRDPLDPSAWTFSHTALLLLWAALALLWALLAGDRPAGNLLLALMPLALLGGQGVERAWGWLRSRVYVSEAGLVAAVAVGLGAFLYLQLAFYARAGSAATVSVAGVTLYATTTYLLLGLVAVLLLVALGAVAWFWRGPALVSAGAWLAGLVILALFGVKSAWGPSFARPADPRELLAPQSTSTDVRLLAGELEELSRDVQGDAHSLPITVDAETGPVVAWYLRSFEKAEVMTEPAGVPETRAAVTLAGDNPAIGETFRGQTFALRTRWSPWGLWGQGLVRWLLFSEGRTPAADREVVLWVADEER